MTDDASPGVAQLTHAEVLDQLIVAPPSGRFREWPQWRPMLKWARNKMAEQDALLARLKRTR